MSAGDFGVAAGALQLVVPSYGLRLVRRFGTSRVGWFVCASFICLAALHLLEPVGPNRGGFGPELMLNCVYAVGSVLLLIGMGHLETLFSQCDRLRSNEEALSSQYEARVQRETAELARANEALQQELAEIKTTEAALRESEAQYRFVFTENPQPMWIVNLREGRFLGVNTAALRQYGFTAEEFLRLTPRDFLPPEQADAFTKDLSDSCARAESLSRWNHYRRDQTLIEVEVAARDFSYAGAPARLMVITDLSAQQRRESEAFQARKMEFAGRIAGGVAQQLNGVLKVLEDHAATLRPSTTDPAATEHVQEISLAVKRGNKLACQMLAISGQQMAEPRPLDLNRLIGNLSFVLRRLCGDKVVFQNLCSPNALPVMGDPHVLEQVLLALVKNARESVADRGMVAVSTAIVRVENPRNRTANIPVGGSANEPARANAKQFVRLSVRDTGRGMSPEIQEHLFEPFFTTKEGASGLGLAGAFGAVRQHGGWIESSSAAASGTEFRIYLPCVSPEMLPSTTEIQAATTLDRGTILLVDADDRSRGVARYILNRNGYRVIEADSASVAQLLWEGQARNIDLLLTDFALPEGGGFDLVNQLRQTRPELKAVYACVDDGGNRPELPGDCLMVSKPYRSDTLLECVEICMPSKRASKLSDAGEHPLRTA